jgi:hypothetical protein
MSSEFIYINFQILKTLFKTLTTLRKIRDNVIGTEAGYGLDNERFEFEHRQS